MTSELRTTSPNASTRGHCYQLDPTQDPRWAQLVATHPKASVFHSQSWLKALQLTYGYEPRVLTTSIPGCDLANGIVFCNVKSWLTGHRLVSLPFSDHCEPLCDSTRDLCILIRHLQLEMKDQEWKCLEFRPLDTSLEHLGDEVTCHPAEEFYFHSVDLRPDLEKVFKNLDRDSVQRRIQRAERANLIEKHGTSEDLLKAFYGLFLTTRRRQRIPPTPYPWFANLRSLFGENMVMRVAYKDQVPIAAIVTLRFKDVLYFKYGGSEARFHKYGATPWLYWQAIVAAKSCGATQFDLGRTDLNNPGLLAFKNQWNPNPKKLIYWQYPAGLRRIGTNTWKWRMAQSVYSWAPRKLQIRIGKMLYPHVG